MFDGVLLPDTNDPEAIRASFLDVLSKLNTLAEGPSAEGSDRSSSTIGIAESGSDANGYFIKYVDGTMECWGNAMTNAGGAIASIPYARPFVAPPSFSCTLHTHHGAVSYHVLVGGVGTTGEAYTPPLVTTPSIQVLKISNTATTVASAISWRAIGKWNLSGRSLPAGTLAGMAVESSGANSNGSFIKYTDGTMICYGRSPAASTETSVAVTFPAAFTSIPRLITSTTQTSGNYDGMFKPIDASTTLTGAVFFHNSFAAGAGTDVCDYMAIGRWK